MNAFDTAPDHHRAWWNESVQRQRDILSGHALRLATFRPRDARADRVARSGATNGKTIDEVIRAIRRDAFGCFTSVLEERAHDDVSTSGTCRDVRLAGRAFAVKDLFDVAGLPTLAGSHSRQGAAPAPRDAVLIQRLRSAGAILVAKCNMDEFAYGFATVNAHFGTTRNPHDGGRLAGGSSGGSAAAVAAGFVPLSLGSDTNGSIRIPAALCGVYGLRPTHGDLPTDGLFPFVDFLDVPGPIAASIGDLLAGYEVMAAQRVQPACVEHLRIARLDGWFQRNLDPALSAGLDTIARHLDQNGTRTWPEAERAWSAAFVLTAAEGGERHSAVLESGGAWIARRSDIARHWQEVYPA